MLFSLVAACQTGLFENIIIKCREHIAGGHGGEVVTHSPLTSEVGGSNSGPYVGKLVVAY